MNILLVMPAVSYILELWPCPPIGVTYVSSYLKSKGHNVYNLNMNLKKDTVENCMRELIEKHDIDVVGCGDLVVNYKLVKEVIDSAKKIKPSVITWIGGSLVSNSPKEAMEIIENADIGIIGEGEVTSDELVCVLKNKGLNIELLKKVPGLIIRTNNDYIITDKRKEIQDLDSLPWPDYEGFELGRMGNKISNEVKLDKCMRMSIVTSRSCPFQCTFCSKSGGGTHYRKRSIENIMLQIDYMVKQFGVKEIFITDELFSEETGRLYEFCKRIKEYKIQWIAYLHIGKSINAEVLEAMADAGCMRIMYGLESADNKILKSMKKGITIEEIERCLLLTKRAGIAVAGNFIFGDVEEDLESAEKTLKWMEEHTELAGFDVGAIILYPGSALYEYAVKNGYIKDTVEFIKAGCPRINISKMTDEEYRELVDVRLEIGRQNCHRKREDVKFSYNKEKEQYEINVKCSNCGSEISKVLDLKNDGRSLFHTNSMTCTKCKNMEYCDVTQNYIELIEEKLKSMLTNGRTACWGVGYVFRLAYRFSDCMKSAEYIMLDRAPKVQYTGFDGHRVYDPSVLVEFKDIDTVICMVNPADEDEVKREINEIVGNREINIISIYALGAM